MIAILKNNITRLQSQRASLWVMVILMIMASAVAIVVSSQPKVVAHVAFVGEVEKQEEAISELSFTSVDAIVPMSEIMLGNYDAVVYKDQGRYVVSQYKNEDTAHLVDALLNQKPIDQAKLPTNRGLGVTMLGFILMFLLMQSSFFMRMFADDKEQGQLARVMTSPVSIYQYLLANCSFCFGLLYGSLMLIFSFVKYGLQLDIGFSFVEYSLLFALICLFATAFSLAMNALIKNADSANMISSAIVVLTSILGGAFYAFQPQSAMLNRLVEALPQHAILAIAQNLEQGSDMFLHSFDILYVIIWVLGFFGIALLWVRRIYVPKVQ